MTSSAPDTNLSERIASAGPDLTPTERRLALIVLDDPTSVAFGTVADLAKKAETSGPSVVRFATKLRFEGYGDLQDHVRASVTEQLRRPTDRIRLAAPSPPLATGQDQEKGLGRGRVAASAEGLADQLNEVVAGLDEQIVTAIATALADADGTVWVLCAETSATPGVLLAGNLRLLRGSVHTLGGAATTMASQLADAGPGDVAIAIDFPRYESAIVSAAAELAATDVTLIAITDGPFSPLASLADIWWGVDIEPVGPFDSVLPVVAVVELIISETAHLLRHQATDRLDRIEHLWTEARVFDKGANGQTSR